MAKKKKKKEQMKQLNYIILNQLLTSFIEYTGDVK